MIGHKEIRSHIISLMMLSLAGWLMHLRIHPPAAHPSNYVPFILGLLNVVAVPLFMSAKRSFLIGYLLNGFGVVFGVVLMSALSLGALPETITLQALILRTTLPYSLVLLPKLLIAQRILYFYHASGTGRLFTAWWWTKHFAYVTIVYTIGHYMWR